MGDRRCFFEFLPQFILDDLLLRKIGKKNIQNPEMESVGAATK